MYGYHYDYPHYPHHPPLEPHGGLVGVAGGLIGLTTASLQGGARIVQSLVEGTLWHSCHPAYTGFYPNYCSPAHHCCHIECLPPTFSCCCC